MYHVVHTITGQRVYSHYDPIECDHWIADNGADSYHLEVEITRDGPLAVSDATGWQVTDPSGKVHTKNRGKRTYTHALIRQNKGDEGSGHYFVNWATSEANVYKESRVLRDVRSYIQVVKLP